MTLAPGTRSSLLVDQTWLWLWLCRPRSRVPDKPPEQRSYPSALRRKWSPSDRTERSPPVPTPAYLPWSSQRLPLLPGYRRKMYRSTECSVSQVPSPTTSLPIIYDSNKNQCLFFWNAQGIWQSDETFPHHKRKTFHCFSQISVGRKRIMQQVRFISLKAEQPLPSIM